MMNPFDISSILQLDLIALELRIVQPLKRLAAGTRAFALDQGPSLHNQV